VVPARGDAIGLRHPDQPAEASRAPLFQQLAVLGWTSLPYLRSIKQPTLILAGDDDPLVPMVNARIMRSLLPHARVHVFHDGHLGLLTSAGDLAPRIERFRESEERGA
jgi:pimeloyl-ACP methyl ester carboxylesterase